METRCSSSEANDEIPRPARQGRPLLEDAGPGCRDVPGQDEVPDGRGRLLLDPGPRGTASWRSILAAARLLSTAGIVYPEPASPGRAGGGSLRALWRPALPTLASLWPDLAQDARAAALHSAGALLRRIHGIALPGFGHVDAATPAGRPLQWMLADELGARGFPAIANACPPALGVVEGLLETIPEVVARAQRLAALSHNEVHLGTLLCARRSGTWAVVGLAVPGDPRGAPPESDLAYLQVARALLRQPLEQGWFDEVLRGYGADLDPVLLAFFRAAHLVRHLIVSAGAAAEPGALDGWLDAASADMELVHGAYTSRIRSAVAAAGMSPSEGAPLLPRRAQRRRATPVHGGA